MNVLSNKPASLRAAFATVSSFEKIVDAVRQRYNYRKTISALNALDDRELEDIGINRSDIEKIAKQTHH